MPPASGWPSSIRSCALRVAAHRLHKEPDRRSQRDALVLHAAYSACAACGAGSISEKMRAFSPERSLRSHRFTLGASGTWNGSLGNRRVTQTMWPSSRSMSFGAMQWRLRHHRSSPSRGSLGRHSRVASALVCAQARLSRSNSMDQGRPSSFAEAICASDAPPP